MSRDILSDLRPLDRVLQAANASKVAVRQPSSESGSSRSPQRLSLRAKCVQSRPVTKSEKVVKDQVRAVRVPNFRVIRP